MLQKTPEARPGSLDNMADACIAWRYTVPVEHTIDDCLRADYWKNTTREAGQQRIVGRHAWNTIECIADDGSWMAELIIVSVEAGLVTVRLKHFWDWFPKKASAVPEGYTVEHVAGNGWRAVDPGGTILIEKKTAREDVIAVAQAHAEKAKAKSASPRKGDS